MEMAAAALKAPPGDPQSQSPVSASSSSGSGLGSAGPHGAQGSFSPRTEAASGLRGELTGWEEWGIPTPTSLISGSMPPNPVTPAPGLDASTLALQQAFIHKQAVLLVSARGLGCPAGGPSLGLPAHPNSLQAREMTLQAMALQQQPLSPTPRPFPPEVSPRGPP